MNTAIRPCDKCGRWCRDGKCEWCDFEAAEAEVDLKVEEAMARAKEYEETMVRAKNDYDEAMAVNAVEADAAMERIVNAAMAFARWVRRSAN